MFEKLLCSIGIHEWIYSFDALGITLEKRRCSRCKKQQYNAGTICFPHWYRIEDYKESEAEILERVYGKS